MANKKIGQLPQIVNQQLTDLKETSSQNVSYKETRQQELNFFNGNAQLNATSQVTGLDLALSNKVSKSGDTMTGDLILAGNPPSNLSASPKQYVDTKLALSGGTMSGSLILNSDPSSALEASTKQYTDTKLSLSGGTMSGDLILNASPTANFQASTKQYTDTKLPLSGGTMSGQIDMGTSAIINLQNPTNPQDASTKFYTDTKLPLSGGIMSGFIDMNNNSIINLQNPTNSQDAANKSYADTKLALSGGTMSGAINMGSNFITNLLDPVNPQDAATKNYVLTNSPATTKYVVGPGLPYTTISSAISAAILDGASATNPKVIYITAGSYTENLTITNVNGLIFYAQGVPLDLRMSYADFISTTSFPTSVKITGNHTITWNNASSENLMQFIGISFTCSSGSIFTLNGDPTLSNLQVLNVKHCDFYVPASGFAFSVTNNVPIDLETSNIRGPGAFFNPSATSNTNSLITVIDSSIFCTGQNVYATGSSVNMRLFNSSLCLMQDATNVTSYTFRAANCNHFGSLGTIVTNTVVPHITGAATTGTIVYNNCNNAFSTSLNIATLGSSSFLFMESNTTYGVQIGNLSGYLVSSGRRFRINTSVRTATTAPILVINDTFLVLGASTFAGFEVNNLTAAIQTTNNTVTNLATLILNEGESVTIWGVVTAAQSDHSNAVGGRFNATFRRQTGGVVTLVGSPEIIVNSSSGATFNVNTDSSTLIRIQVTGVAATTYNWGCQYFWQKILTNA